MYLYHGFQHVLCVLRFRHGYPTQPKVTSSVGGDDHSRTGAIEVVRRITDASDAGDVGGCAASAIDGLGEVLPKASGEL